MKQTEYKMYRKPTADAVNKAEEITFATFIRVCECKPDLAKSALMKLSGEDRKRVRGFLAQRLCDDGMRIMPLIANLLGI